MTNSANLVDKNYQNQNLILKIVLKSVKSKILHTCPINNNGVRPRFLKLGPHAAKYALRYPIL